MGSGATLENASSSTIESSPPDTASSSGAAGPRAARVAHSRTSCPTEDGITGKYTACTSHRWNRRLWLALGRHSIFAAPQFDHTHSERYLGNSWPARHSLGRTWTVRLLHRARLDQYAARLRADAAVHSSRHLAAGQGARQGPRA